MPLGLIVPMHDVSDMDTCFRACTDDCSAVAWFDMASFRSCAGWFNTTCTETTVKYCNEMAEYYWHEQINITAPCYHARDMINTLNCGGASCIFSDLLAQNFAAVPSCNVDLQVFSQLRCTANPPSPSPPAAPASASSPGVAALAIGVSVALILAVAVLFACRRRHPRLQRLLGRDNKRVPLASADSADIDASFTSSIPTQAPPHDGSGSSRDESFSSTPGSLRRHGVVELTAIHSGEARRREADSRMMHLVKGLCSGALMSLSSFNDLRSRQPNLQRELPPHMAQLVEQPEAQLKLAIDYCHRRQVFQDLEDGSYRTHRVEIDIQSVLEKALGADGIVRVIGPERGAVDVTMLSIIIDEVLSNSRKYREPDSAITIEATHSTSGDASSSSSSSRELLRIEIINDNKAGVRSLTEEECRRILEPKYKAHNATATSTGIGLDTVAVAVAAAHGRVWFSTRSDVAPARPQTVCHIELPISQAPSSPVDRSSLSTSPTSSEPQATTAALPPPPLVALGLDDDPFMRQVHAALFENYLNLEDGAHQSLGATDEEIDAFVDVAMGSTPDYIILDQNIERPSGQEVLGTEIAAALQERRFNGVVTIFTASSAHEIGRIRSLPGVDLVFEKGTKLGVVAASMRQCREEKRGAATESV